MCFSKRKKKEKEMAERIRQLEERDKVMTRRLAESQACHCDHGHKHEEKSGRRAGWVLTTNGGRPVPAAPPSDFIQLTPIVQPVPLVPYSSQRQPMFIIEDGDDDAND